MNMDRDTLKKRLEGCYVTVPTMFNDPEFELDLKATRGNVGFLIERGINADNAVLLAGGAAGDFSTMTFDERLAVAEAILEESAGRMPVAMGAQTTSTGELIGWSKPQGSWEPTSYRFRRLSTSPIRKRTSTNSSWRRQKRHRRWVSSFTTLSGPAATFPATW